MDAGGFVAEELAYLDIEYEFFDYGDGSWVRRWLPSWGLFAYWLIDPEGCWYGAFTQVQWDLLRVCMMLVMVAPFGVVNGSQTERGHLAPVHGGFGRSQVCRVARFAQGKRSIILLRPCICLLVLCLGIAVWRTKIGDFGR